MAHHTPRAVPPSCAVDHRCRQEEPAAGVYSSRRVVGGTNCGPRWARTHPSGHHKLTFAEEPHIQKAARERSYPQARHITFTASLLVICTAQAYICGGASSSCNVSTGPTDSVASVGHARTAQSRKNAQAPRPKRGALASAKTTRCTQSSDFTPCDPSADEKCE